MRQAVADVVNLVFGFRKFLLLLALVILGSTFRVLNYISGAEMVDLFKSTTIAFMSANGIEHLVTVAREFVAAKSSGTAFDAKEEGHQ